MHAVEVETLVVRYGRVTAVDGVSFTAEAGTVVALLGPNGAGKTTTVETLEGYRRPSAGRVRVLGLDPIADHRALVPRIGVMLQRGGVYLTMGPEEVINLFAAYWGDRSLDPALLLDRLGLRKVARTPWRRLSGGEQQRLSLALALVGRPEVAFLDEPTAAVDPAARLVVRDIVQELRAEGCCVVLTTHDVDEAEKAADRVIIMNGGTIVAAGAPAELTRRDAPDSFRFGAPPGLDVASLGAAVGAGVHEERAGEYVVATAPTPAAVAAVTAWLAGRDLPLDDLRAGRTSLEDVFLRLVGSDAARRGSAHGTGEGDDDAEDTAGARRGRRRAGASGRSAGGRSAGGRSRAS